MAVRIAFFKAKNGDAVDKAIDLLTGGAGYSHSALVLTPSTTIESHYLTNGVAKCYYNNLIADNRWDVVEVDADNTEAVTYAMNQIGLPYDLWGIFINYLYPIVDRKGIWCSELTCKAYKAAGGSRKNKDTLVFPNQHFKKLISDGGKIVSESIFSTYGHKKEIDYMGRIGYEQ